MKTTKNRLFIPAFILITSITLGGAFALTKSKETPTSATSVAALLQAPHQTPPGDPDSLGAIMSYGNFITATNMYKGQHPGATFGGRIGKATLQTIINSMTPENKYVNFYFATENGKTYLIFIPAGLKSDGSIYRNAGYCPTFCNDN